MAGFEKLLDAVADHSLLWKSWIDSDTPEAMEYPPPYGGEVSLPPFRKLMLLRYMFYLTPYLVALYIEYCIYNMTQ